MRLQGRARIGFGIAITVVAAGLGALTGPIAAHANGLSSVPAVHRASAFSLPYASTPATRPATPISSYDPLAATPEFQDPASWFVNGYNPVANHSACLDGDLNTMPANGTKVQTWQCNTTLQQNWTFKAVPGMQYWYTITNGKDGQCLDGDLNTMGANGTKVQLWACNGWSNQQWYVSSPDGEKLRLQNGYSLRFLDADRNTAGVNGQRVQLWDGNGWTNQDWYSLEP